jgi:hypothetical protein
MTEPESEHGETLWKKFIRRHSKILVLFITAAIIAVISAVLVLLWFVGDAQATGLVPRTLNLWTLGYLVTFLLHLLFWEVLFIGIPVIITVAAIYFLWWKKLPAEERHDYQRGHLFGKRSRSRDGGGAITFLVNIGFIIKVYLDGNWNVPFATWTFDYLVYSYLWVIIWMVIIFGIPLVIGLIWWLHRNMEKTA